MWYVFCVQKTLSQVTFIPNCMKSMEKTIWVYNTYDNYADSSKKNVQDVHRFPTKRLQKWKKQCEKMEGWRFGKSARWSLMSARPHFDRSFKERQSCVSWIIRMLTEEHKWQRVEVACERLEVHETDGKKNLGFITGHETWVHYKTPKTKEESCQWKHPESPEAAQVQINIARN